MTMTADDRWTDDPIDPSAWWAQEAAMLRRHPGHWRNVRFCSKPDSAKSMARDIRNGTLVAFRPVGAYDARARGTTVKAVYIGEGAEQC